MKFLIAPIALIGLTAAAQAAETKLMAPDIEAALNDKSLYADAVEQIFQTGGNTAYIDHGNLSQGRWKIENDQYCSQWPPSKGWACYDVTREGGTITFIDKGGTRYPMRDTK